MKKILLAGFVAAITLRLTEELVRLWVVHQVRTYSSKAI